MIRQFLQGSEAAAERIDAALRQKPASVIALPGGRSVVPLCETLCARALRGEINFAEAEFFLLDERLTAPAQQNFELLTARLFRPLWACGRLNERQVHRPSGATAEEAASGYSRLLACHGGCFDLAIIGVGEDGHIASLFPRHPALRLPQAAYIVVSGAPKAPPLRVSASLPLIQQSGEIFALFLGPEKEQALRRYCDSMVNMDDCPVKAIDQAAQVNIVTDRPITEE